MAISAFVCLFQKPIEVDTIQDRKKIGLPVFSGWQGKHPALVGRSQRALLNMSAANPARQTIGIIGAAMSPPSKFSRTQLYEACIG